MLLTAMGDAQIPLLAAMLLGGCSTKFARAVRRRSMSAGLGPTALFPLRLRPLAAGTLSAVELGIGIGLIVTAGTLGAGAPAKLVRIGACLLFVVATFALIELRSIRPDIGCGCFGEFSAAPITGRTLTRSSLLAIAALGAEYAPAIEPPRRFGDVAPILIFLAIELGIIGALSPEVRDLLVRVGYSEPCELRMPSPEQTLSALRRSSQWRRHLALLVDDEPLDVWRELCWRYVAFPSRLNGRDAELVFAVYLQNRRPVVLSVLVDATTGAVIPWPTSSGRPVGWRWARLLRRGNHAAPHPELPVWLGDSPSQGRLAGQAHAAAVGQDQSGATRSPAV
ncbi:MAG TPA: MauE/DoxX family redox-associated membrane protein [Streptosporangiaceae bacterium]